MSTSKYLIKLLLMLILMSIVVLLAITIANAGYIAQFAITYYHPEHAPLFDGKHSLFAAVPLFMPFMALLLLSPILLILLYKAVECQFDITLQQSQEKISGMARTTADWVPGSRKPIFYVTVPDRQGRTWSFPFGSNSITGVGEGEYPAEIYFRGGIESPSLVAIKGDIKLIPQGSSPKMSVAPCRPPDIRDDTIGISFLPELIIIVSSIVGFMIDSINNNQFFHHLISFTLENLLPIIESPVVIIIIAGIIISIIAGIQLKKFF